MRTYGLARYWEPVWALIVFWIYMRAGPISSSWVPWQHLCLLLLPMLRRIYLIFEKSLCIQWRGWWGARGKVFQAIWWRRPNPPPSQLTHGLNHSMFLQRLLFVFLKQFEFDALKRLSSQNRFIGFNGLKNGCRDFFDWFASGCHPGNRFLFHHCGSLIDFVATIL